MSRQNCAVPAVKFNPIPSRHLHAGGAPRAARRQADASYDCRFDARSASAATPMHGSSMESRPAHAGRAVHQLICVCPVPRARGRTPNRGQCRDASACGLLQAGILGKVTPARIAARMTPNPNEKAALAHGQSRPPQLSVVVPCHNEEGNLEQLVSEIRQTLSSMSQTYEVVLVDDASTDGTWNLLQRLGEVDPRIRGMRFATQGGQSAAMWAGLQHARGEILITLDADLQNPPSEIPRLLAALEGWDCVCGSRVMARSAGDTWIRRVSSKIANAFRAALTQDGISDSGCCFRALRRACVQPLRFFKGAHRLLPALLLLEGFRVKEIHISHRPRGAGHTHYGVWNRLIKSLPDLFAVRWMKSRHIRYHIVATVNPPKENAS